MNISVVYFKLKFSGVHTMDEEEQRRKAQIQKLLEMNAKALVSTDLHLWIGSDSDSDTSDSATDSEIIWLDSDTDCEQDRQAENIDSENHKRSVSEISDDDEDVQSSTKKRFDMFVSNKE
jgi:hypothetical protein